MLLGVFSSECFYLLSWAIKWVAPLIFLPRYLGYLTAMSIPKSQVSKSRWMSFDISHAWPLLPSFPSAARLRLMLFQHQFDPAERESFSPAICLYWFQSVPSIHPDHEPLPLRPSLHVIVSECLRFPASLCPKINSLKSHMMYNSFHAERSVQQIGFMYDCLPWPTTYPSPVPR